ncbi:hypothetical protein Aca07nite_12570 [Actinoplanes capillaceus]|uniref:Methylamine utilisation protein MauE domain-containing protein n=1 Tax=Actinoplanes campanulatus TaxID=113559 RepID=A0ABQ3WD74_9ACTN|nr:MauE/DoxX family redox-associated membrane protein [Actinoplanes capillaceus]GID43982.1 hypothetical protein Aca07nite_12570 [Actinoplanes capillaceus]
MHQQVATAIAVGGALLLLAAGVGHLRRRAHLAAVLAAQRMVPRWSHRPLAAVVAVAEVGAGAGAVAGWLTASWPLMIPASAVYAAFGVYTTVLRIRRPGTPCGCFDGDSAVSWSVVARAWMFCCAAIVAASALSADAATAGRMVIGCAAILVALITWLAPQLVGVGRPVRTGGTGSRR